MSTATITQNIFDQVVSQITYGVIPDLETAIYAIIALHVIYLGFNMLIGYLNRPISSSGHLDYAAAAYNIKENVHKDGFAHEYYESLYRGHLNEAVSIRVDNPYGSHLELEDDSAFDYDLTSSINGLEMEPEVFINSEIGDDGVLEMESSSSSTPLTDWTSFQESITGLEMEESSGASASLHDWTTFQESKEESTGSKNSGPSDEDRPGWL